MFTMVGCIIWDLFCFSTCILANLLNLSSFKKELRVNLQHASNPHLCTGGMHSEVCNTASVMTYHSSYTLRIPPVVLVHVLYYLMFSQTVLDLFGLFLQFTLHMFFLPPICLSCYFNQPICPWCVNVFNHLIALSQRGTN